MYSINDMCSCVTCVLVFLLSECGSLSTVPGDTSDASIETFSLTTSTALFTLATPVDFEYTDVYTMVLEVVDHTNTPERTGTIGIRVLFVTLYNII